MQTNSESDVLKCKLCNQTFLSSNSHEKHYSTQKHKTNKTILDLSIDNKTLKNNNKELNTELNKKNNEIIEIKSRIDEITQMANEDIISHKLNNKKNKEPTNNNYILYSTFVISISFLTYLLKRHIV